MDKNTIKNAFDIINLSSETENKVLDNLLKQSRKDGIVMKKTNRRKPITVIAAAAAAAVFTISAGAAVYTQFIHRDSVERYLIADSPEILEEQGLALNYVTQNEHLKMTVDTVLSDGYYAIAIVTMEPLDNIGQSYISDWQIPESAIRYADGDGEYVMLHIDEENSSYDRVRMYSAGYASRDEDEIDSSRFVMEYNLEYIDTTRPLNIDFYLEKSVGETDELGLPINNDAEGMSISTSFAPNIQTAILKDENGNEISMSQFELYSDDIRLLSDMDFRFITTSGKRVKLSSGYPESSGYNEKDGKMHSYLAYGEFINLDDYIGVELNGVEYLKQ